MTANAGFGSVQGRPLLSDFSADEDMRDLISMFVAELPDRIRALQTLSESGGLEQLCRLAHQMKGASGGYGFPVLGAAAGRLEESVVNSLSCPDPAATLPAIRAQVDGLIELCRRVRVA